MNYLFYIWKYVPLNPLGLFHSPPNPAIISLFSVSMNLFSFCFVF